LKDNIYFKVKTPLNKEIRITKEYWDFVKTVKHPNMVGKEKEIIKTLKDPEFIRKSKKDGRVYLYYKSTENYYICVACKHLNGEGFIITTYITDRVKEGEEIWRKS
jgi:hypothetical protein